MIFDSLLRLVRVTSVLIIATFCLIAPQLPAQNELLNHPGRLLASNCFQCHGTNGHSANEIDSLQGEDDIYQEMHEMQSDQANDNIMYVHAQAYTDEEIRLIADYFASMPEKKDDDEDDEQEDEEKEKDE